MNSSSSQNLIASSTSITELSDYGKTSRPPSSLSVSTMQKHMQQKHRQSQGEITTHNGAEATPAQILERVKPDKVTVTKPEEDRRRRTIIVEKKNGSYGFTLQSYGIHYKKEQEIEMITYVDYVDYDGPAFRAGMREGDVILSINGTDMEKADHKTLVGFIKNCDARMRMVVLFEDCVRKVELHMRYIQLQRILQSKMSELEKLCLKERQLLEGKWKTHSLPARKKTTSGPEPETPTELNRAALSSEDIINGSKSTNPRADALPQPPPPALMLAYQYLNPQYQTYIWQPSRASGNGEYLLSFRPPRYKPPKTYEPQHFFIKTPANGKPLKNSKVYAQGSEPRAGARAEGKKCHRGHMCAPCIRTNQDNVSLEAYDLASPCCDPHCVPTARRRSSRSSSHHHSNKHKEHYKNETSKSSTRYDKTDDHDHYEYHKSQNKRLVMNGTHVDENGVYVSAGGQRYFNISAAVGLVSQCSLYSCTSSEFSAMPQESQVLTNPRSVKTDGNSSYTTSLSTDTLYWNPTGNEPNHSNKSSLKHKHQQTATYYYDVNDARNERVKGECIQTHQPRHNHHHHHHHHHNHQHGQLPSKPKSWDNLTTKAFGGYGFGYGYLDVSRHKVDASGCHSRTQSVKSSASLTRASPRPVSTACCASSKCSKRYAQPTKSSESLLAIPKCEEQFSDSSVSCECLDASNVSTTDSQYYMSNISGYNSLETNRDRSSLYEIRNESASTSKTNTFEKEKRARGSRSNSYEKDSGVYDRDGSVRNYDKDSVYERDGAGYSSRRSSKVINHGDPLTGSSASTQITRL